MSGKSIKSAKLSYPVVFKLRLGASMGTYVRPSVPLSVIKKYLSCGLDISVLKTNSTGVFKIKSSVSLPLKI